ncbi:putative sporulation protein YtxC [Radiobacillus kanasensis]|uniref:sporulation protein YtxC n=1 Tax=Radiobacillus kanasensis TaxID=2844358 RepID=UPI001E629460|nr:sporulation protein YtxC [Radiobacillus kanasensis]UFT97994.1 putative sporulation protein YtxC [Radiobacillus kanasensis]
MFEVYFELEEEARTFRKLYGSYDKHAELQWMSDEKWGNKVVILQSHELHTSEYLTKAIADVFVHHRESKWMEHTVRDTYYFRNKVEVQRIVELTLAIVNGTDEDLKLPPEVNQLHPVLHKVIKKNVLGKEMIHYDSIVKFRFKDYQEELMEVVGLAIDEYKREEEYQAFIQSLREYILKKKAKMDHIHIVQGSHFSFYRHNGTRLMREELKQYIRKEPMFIVGLDENEWNLAPLLSLAPKQITVYGDDPSDPKTLTVYNVFQERVKVKPLKEFPFSTVERNSLT